SPSCHGVSWTDDHAQTWSGVPLWLLAGRVDDEEPHKGEAFNRELAAAGYTLDVVAADGYSATFDVARIQEVADILVAYMVNENPLDEDHFPLRLVGNGLSGGEMVSQITSIVVHSQEPQPGESAEAPAEEDEPAEAAPAAEPQECAGALGVSGAVGAPACWSLEEFELVGAVERTVEHPKKGAQDYTGMLMQALFTLVQPAEGASTVTFIAGDGYSVALPLADVLSCADCMVALD
ncbi:MAG: molybdopterin-dependent oxidoreductase, partial [Anaerolineales bacterium]|nr:molybdopterin-dependent oxidoreductase [Anaerolineales bacterium]